MPEDLFQILFVKTRHNSEHALPIKTAVCTQNVQVRIESQKIAERLNGDNGAGYRTLFGHNLFEKDLQRIAVYCEKDVRTVVQLFLRLQGKSLIKDEFIESTTSF